MIDRLFQHLKNLCSLITACICLRGTDNLRWVWRTWRGNMLELEIVFASGSIQLRLVFLGIKITVGVRLRVGRRSLLGELLLIRSCLGGRYESLRSTRTFTSWSLVRSNALCNCFGHIMKGLHFLNDFRAHRHLLFRTTIFEELIKLNLGSQFKYICNNIEDTFHEFLII